MSVSRHTTSALFLAAVALRATALSAGEGDPFRRFDEYVFRSTIIMVCHAVHDEEDRKYILEGGAEIGKATFEQLRMELDVANPNARDRNAIVAQEMLVQREIDIDMKAQEAIRLKGCALLERETNSSGK